MTAEKNIDKIAETLAEEAKKICGDCFDSVVLFGSYSRGDYDKESDMDFLVKINADAPAAADVGNKLAPVCSRLSLEYDVTVSVTTATVENFNTFKSVLPFYANIDREGIKIA